MSIEDEVAIGQSRGISGGASSSANQHEDTSFALRGNAFEQVEQLQRELSIKNKEIADLKVALDACCGGASAGRRGVCSVMFSPIVVLLIALFAFLVGLLF